MQAPDLPAPIARLPRRLFSSGVVLILLTAVLAIGGHPPAVLLALVPLGGLVRYAQIRGHFEGAAGWSAGAGTLRDVVDGQLLVGAGAIPEARVRRAYGKWEEPPSWLPGMQLAFLAGPSQTWVCEGDLETLERRVVYLGLHPLWTLTGLAYLPALFLVFTSFR